MKIRLVFLLTIIAFASMKNSAQEQTMILKTPTGDLSGVLSKPSVSGKIPVVLLISGSGPTDKDGNQPNMQNNSLKMIADALAANGIASLRFDKRGIGASKAAFKQEADLRFDNFVNDAEAWINLLAKDENFSQIVVAGHSEGSLIGMIAANQNNKVSRYISLSGAGLPADEILREQLNAQPEAVQNITSPMLDSLKKGKTVANVPPGFEALFRPSVQPYLISWFKYDPQIEIAKLKIPVLILQGDHDIQVSIHNAELLAAADKNAALKIIPNMNHILKTVDSTDRAKNISTYSDPNLPINPELMRDIVEFIKK